MRCLLVVLAFALVSGLIGFGIGEAIHHASDRSAVDRKVATLAANEMQWAYLSADRNLLVFTLKDKKHVARVRKAT